VTSLALAHLALAAALAAPAAQAPSLTEEVRARIIEEVRPVVQAMMAASQRLDIDAAIKDCQDTPETLVVGSDGTITDFKSLREELRGFYASQASLRFTPIREVFQVLAPDLVLYAWTYRVDGASRKGRRWVIDPEAASFLLRKVDGAWKFIFFHESSGPAKAAVEPAAPSKAP
jgi:hypothetical protein